MKKLVSLILCFALALTLCSCANTSDNPSGFPSGNAVKGNFSLEFKNLSAGYITHTSELNSSVMASEEFECMDDFYVYLPKGSTLASAQNFAVYCYNQHFTLDTTLTANCGQTLVRFSPKLCPDTRTLTEDCYVRFSVQGKVADIAITVPDGKEAIVISGAKDELLYGPQINVVQQNLKDKDSAVNYIFITDLHYDKDPTAQKSEALLKQVKAAVKIAGVTGKVLSYHFGHTHRELTRYCKDIDLWQINTATAQVSTNAEIIGSPKVTEDDKGNDWVSYDRQYGSDYEACFDIISVGEGIIHKYAFGAGTDEVLEYGQ